MKNYIKNVHSLKKGMSETRSKADIKQKSKLRSELFLGQKVKSSTAHLEDEKVMKDDHDEIATRKADLPKELQKMDKISKVLHSLLESSNSVTGSQIDNIIERYNGINKMEDIYQETINIESTEKFPNKNYAMNQN